MLKKYFKSSNTDVKEECPYKKLTLTKLKEICREKKIKMSGKKPDLLSRLRRFDFLSRLKKSENMKDVYSDHKDMLILNKYVFLYNEEIKEYLSVLSFDGYKFIINIKTRNVDKKINMITNEISSLSREDVHYCNLKRLPVLIPIVLTGEPLKKRSVDLEEDEEDIFYECE